MRACLALAASALAVALCLPAGAQPPRGGGDGPRFTEHGRELDEQGRGPGFGPTAPEGGSL